MEEFTRVDIYDTKGIEYLFVIGYLVVFILFWKLARNPQIIRQIKHAISTVSASLLKIPQGVFFNKHHTWTHLGESGEAKVGLDDFLKHVTGKIKFSQLKKPGEEIGKGELLTVIDQGGKQLKVYSPISGKILNTNSILNEDQEDLITDPYENGWIYKVKPSNWVKETSAYYLGEEATDWATKEVVRFKDFLSGDPMEKYPSAPSMVFLQDGGEIRENVLTDLPDEVWEKFQEEFLDFS